MTKNWTSKKTPKTTILDPSKITLYTGDPKNRAQKHPKSGGKRGGSKNTIFMNFHVFFNKLKYNNNDIKNYIT